MKRPIGYARSQNGYTLIEVIIASALGVVVMTALTSVVLTTWRAGTIATSRVEASSQIRSFEFYAYDDFARSGAPVPSGCGAPGNPCTTQPLVLGGFQASNSATPVPAAYQVTYKWDSAQQFLDRQVGSNAPLHAATSVSAFSWYVDPASQSVVVTLTVTVQAYTQYQTFRFLPRLNP
jgi:prepilin-type N-terminal cleavage/methylation domain-containing protein